MANVIFWTKKKFSEFAQDMLSIVTTDLPFMLVTESESY